MFKCKMALLQIQLICFLASTALVNSQACTTLVKLSPSAMFLSDNHIYVISQNHSNPNQVVVLNLPTDFDGLPRTQDKDKRISSSLRSSPTAVVVDTSNLILVFADDQAISCSLARDRFACSPTNKASDYFESINPATKVRAATRNATSLILITEEPDQKVWHRSYSQQLNANNKYDLTGGLEYIDQTTLPSAITAVNDTYAEYIVIFSDFWTIFTAQQLETQVKLDIKSNNQIRLARTFSGCPVDLCFEGDLDAAHVGVNGDFILFRGKHIWTLNLLSKDTKLGTPSQSIPSVHLDAAFSINNVNYFVKNDIISSFAYNRTVGQAFTGYTGQIDAIYTSNGMVYLLSGQTYSSYVVNQAVNSFENVVDDMQRIDSKWPGISNDIDAALELRGSQDVILFKGSFHFRANVNGGSVKPQLNMNTLYQCEDNVYYDLSRSIGIVDFKEFKDYIMKFCPVSNCRPSQISGPGVTESSSTAFIISLLIVVVGSIAVIALVVWYLLKKDPNVKRSSLEKQDTLVDKINSTQSIKSMETTSFVPSPNVATGSTSMEGDEASTGTNTNQEIVNTEQSNE